MISRVSMMRVQQEDVRATGLHGMLPNPDRGMVILMEEMGEAAERVLQMGRGKGNENKEHDYYKDEAVKELIETASVALRLATQIDEGIWPTKSS